jgi:hypothetical protein
MVVQLKVITLFNKFIRDKNDHIAIWQTPNVPIIGWLICTLTSHFVASGHFKTAFGYLGVAFLFTWAYLEIKDGSSHFRRLLGLIVFLGVVIELLYSR